ncbi:MAG: YraN family protein [Calditrichaeota bacterium]|nr:YraN family protein [Calditrichota bacterium]RQW02754.1 MAG: YraN family protein [Calditrichota bacterium]
MQKSTLEKGKWAEEKACDYLIKKSYTVLHRNWGAERGDIDIIAREGNRIIFVEVKGGISEKYGPPELRLTYAKKRQLYKLASLYIRDTDPSGSSDVDYQFDVIVVDGHPGKYEIRHYENAFYL